MKWLKGKKTYTIAVGTALGVIGGVLTGEMSTAEGIQLLLTAVFASTIRHGVSTETKKDQ